MRDMTKVTYGNGVPTREAMKRLTYGFGEDEAAYHLRPHNNYGVGREVDNNGVLTFNNKLNLKLEEFIKYLRDNKVEVMRYKTARKRDRGTITLVVREPKETKEVKAELALEA